MKAKTGAGKAMRREAAALISDARATTKHVNVIKESVEVGQGADEEVRIRVAVAAAASRSLAYAIRDLLLPVRPHATVRVARAADAAIAGGSWDVVVVIADGEDPAVVDATRTFARAGLPVVVVAESQAKVPDLGPLGMSARRVTTIACADPAELERRLADWLVRATGKGLAMAASFPFARAAEAELLARECAGQNAMIGALSLVPGSDLPVMAANEVRVAIVYATLFGQGVSPARGLEILAVISATMTQRRIAKAMSLPGIGLLVRAGIDYMGTLVACRMLARYYERLEREGGLGKVVVRMMGDALRQTTDSFAGEWPLGEAV